MGETLFRRQLEGLKEYVPGKPAEEVKKELGLQYVIKLASNENPLGPSSKAVEAIKNEVEKINFYPDSLSMELREALGKKLDVKKEQIFIANGGEETLRLIADTFINEGDEAIIPYPTFDIYNISVSIMGGKIVAVPLKENMEYDLDKMLEQINEKTKLIYLCSPNNPTGNIIGKAQLFSFLDKVPENIVIVLDEAYYEYARRNLDYPNGIEILRDRKNMIVMRTFSKVVGIAGVRIGYVVTSEEICRQMHKVKNTFTTNRLAQAAALAALEDDDYIEKVVDLNYEALAMMERLFEEYALEYVKSNANFVFVNIGIDSKTIFNDLMQRGIIIRPGHIWGKNTWIRVSTGTLEDTQTFVNELRDLLKNFRAEVYHVKTK